MTQRIHAPLFGSIIAASLLLQGCNMAPKYVQPDMPVPPATPDGAAYTGPISGSIVPADTAWRDFFTDPRLARVIETALTNNRDLRIAVANVEQARAQYRVQRADIFPTLGADASATFQDSPTAGTTGTGGSGRRDSYSASLGISSWEIDLFGRTRNLTEAAQQEFFAVEQNRNAAQTALIAEIATAWLTMAADQERLRIARDLQGAFGRTLELTKARRDGGISSGLDVSQAQTSFDQARSDIANLTTLVAQDRNALNLLAGTALGDDILPQSLGSQGATIDNLPGELPSEVLLRRPDIAAAEFRLRAANANIGAARAAFFPTISLTAALGTISSSLSGLFGGGSDYWSVAPGASVSIFDFGRNQANLDYAKATRDAMVAEYEKSIQSAFREVADALARRGTIDEQLAAQSSLRDASATSYRLSEARFRARVDSFLVTLDAQRTLYSAETSLVSARLIRQTNAVELYRALGGGLK